MMLTVTYIYTNFANWASFCQQFWVLWYRAKSCDIVLGKFIVNGKLIFIKKLFAAYICSVGQNVKNALRNYAHSKNLKLADLFHADLKKIGILIGLNSHFKFTNGHIRRGNENGLIFDHN